MRVGDVVMSNQLIYTLSEGLTFQNQEGKSLFERYIVLPGGELHFKIREIPNSEIPIMLLTRLNNSEDLVKLIMVSDTLKNNGIKFDLFIPYIPGGRQDRIEIKGEPFTLQTICKLINNLAYEKLYTYSPHSNVTLALLRDVTNYYLPGYWWQVMNANINQGDHAWIIAPDEGASKRSFNIYKHLKPEFPNLHFAQALKIRNAETGLIETIECLEFDLDRYPCFIFDDICDGGRTFNLLASDLINRNCGSLHLVVDHGIFSRGTDELKKNFISIYSTNSILNDCNNVIIKQL